MPIGDISSELRTRITDKIIRVLKLNHSDAEKQTVLDGRKRLNFACPYCGDSTVDKRKKRGNLYWDDLFYHCYNCSVHISLDLFLSEFNESLENNDKIDVLNYIQANKKIVTYGENLDFYLFETINELALTFEEISLAFNVYPINELSYRVYPYLKSRLLHNKLERFGYNPRTKELYIFNMNRDNNVVGFQVRCLDQTGGPKYKTWNLERIYDRLKRPLSANYSEIDINNLNKISMIFGILTVDLSREFNIFEGPIDAMFMNNSIGLTGVKKQILDFNEIPTARYFFDNDIEGKNKMIEKIKMGQSVFLWAKFISDYNLPGKSIKDFNDLIKYEYKNRKGCLSNLDKYFSNNHLDMIFI